MEFEIGKVISRCGATPAIEKIGVSTKVDRVPSDTDTPKRACEDPLRIEAGKLALLSLISKIKGL